ncbi:MAG: MFS transporter [Planctomycetota bacterium]|nr:MFS transporter [Planctomycetota bacterium]
MGELHEQQHAADSGRLSGTQCKALIAAWLGWCFDGLDGYLYLMVATRFVRQLLERHADQPVTEAAVQAKVAIIQCFFLVGWAVGGMVFGRIGDRLGRTRTLTLTVLTYAVFTGAAFFADTWWHLLIFRFVAALGIGGEWAAGSALVAESLPSRHRTWATATLQSGYIVGCIAAALTAKMMAGLEPHWVFLVGVLPAFLTLWIRRAVPEPDEWASHAEPTPPVWALFHRGLRRTTVLITLLTSIALTTVWAFLSFSPSIIMQLPDLQDRSPQERQVIAANASMIYLLVNIAANYFAAYLAHWLGHRRAFALLMAAAGLVFWFGFHRPLHAGEIYVLYSLTAFFGLGLFGLFPLYIPPLFPTKLRTLGAGFTYNVGRLVSAAGVLVGGQISATAGSPASAVAWIGLLYIPGVIIACFVPELHRRERDAV